VSRRISASVRWATLCICCSGSLPHSVRDRWMGETTSRTASRNLWGSSLMPALRLHILQACIVRANGTDKALADGLGRDIKGKRSPFFCLAGIGLGSSTHCSPARRMSAGLDCGSSPTAASRKLLKALDRIARSERKTGAITGSTSMRHANAARSSARRRPAKAAHAASPPPVHGIDGGVRRNAAPHRARGHRPPAPARHRRHRIIISFRRPISNR